METLKRSGRTSLSRSDSFGQSSGSSSTADNRSSTKKQAELQAMADRRGKKRNRKKTLKNILSLGIRKMYVNYKRKKRNDNQALEVVDENQTPEPQADESMESFVKAYEASRFYHSSKGNYIDSIDKHGLLIDADRRANTEVGDVNGYSSISSEYSGHEKQGVFMSTKKHRVNYQNTYPAPAVRLFLSKDQATKRNKTLQAYSKIDEPAGPGLYSDGSGGLISRISIPAEQVTKDNISDLLDSPKLKIILLTIASHYPDGTAPSLDVLEALLRQAITEDNPQTSRRRLSNAQLDNA